MAQKLVITFDEATTARYLELARHKTEAEVNAECCPTGAALRIDISGPWGSSATFIEGNSYIEIGDIDVKLIEA